VRPSGNQTGGEGEALIGPAIDHVVSRRPSVSLLIIISLVAFLPLIVAAAAPPEINSFSPSRGPTGITVTLVGNHLESTTNVRFGNEDAQFQIVSQTELTTTVPTTATTGPITVTTTDGMVESAGTFQVQPNIVLILTDDQRNDEMSMPTVKSELAAKGTTFKNGFVVDPLCCPSRTTILTGKYSHGTDIYDNKPPHGGFQTFFSNGEESSTIATWLDDAGYHTGLVGKYLNGYNLNHASYIPPGWDSWQALAIQGRSEGLYYNYSLSNQGSPEFHGTAASDYSTDVLSSYAKQFVTDAPSDQPLFLYFATVAPHLRARPPRRYRNAFPNLQPLRPPSYNEADVSDKPQYVQAMSQLSPAEQSRRDSLRRRQFQSLLAVDDGVKSILDALAATGRLGSTLIVYASDNGLAFGEHRWTKKRVPYEESIRVPMVVRYDPLTQQTGRIDPHLVLNLDFAPTFAAAAQVSSPGSDGASFLPLLRGDPTGWRTDFLIEHANATTGEVPAYCAVRNAHYKYVEYETGEQELYDLRADPFELDSLAADPSYAGVRDALHSRLVKLCSPPPPGLQP
jgi:N-acetylglucosamine-6-sulfatase